MTSQVVVDSFVGSGTLAGTSPGVLTGVSAASWVTYDQTITANLAFHRGGVGATVVVPASGDTNFARLDISGNATHTAGLTIVEALVRPEFTMRIALDFEDRTATLGVSTSGAGSWSMFNGTNGSGSFTAATPGATVALRIEIGPTQTQFFVDNVLVGTRTTAIPYGIRVEFVRFNFPRLTTHGLTPGSTVDALKYVHLKTEASTGALGGPVSADTEGPSFGSGVITINAQYEQYTASWPSAFDNVTLPGALTYEYRIDGGAWTSLGTAVTVTRTGRTPGSSEDIEVRAKDAAGNYSSIISATATTFDRFAQNQLFGDRFTKTGRLHGSPGQTGIHSRTLWVANNTFFGRGGDLIPGNAQPGEYSRITEALVRTPDGLKWLGEGDITTLSGYVPAGEGSAISYLPLAIEAGGWGDFSVSAGIHTSNGVSEVGTVSAGVGITTVVGTTYLYSTSVPAGGGWTINGPFEPARRAISPVTNDQYNVLRMEVSLTTTSIFLNDVLVGSGPSNANSTPGKRWIAWALAAYHHNGIGSGPFVAAKGLTQLGETPLKLDYFNFWSGVAEVGVPLGPPRDPADDPPLTPDDLSPPGPGNEPPVEGPPYTDFWTAFNKTYEVP